MSYRLYGCVARSQTFTLTGEECDMLPAPTLEGRDTAYAAGSIAIRLARGEAVFQHRNGCKYHSRALCLQQRALRVVIVFEILLQRAKIS